MAIRFHPSARRHAISESRARHVIEHCPDPIYPTPASVDEPDLVLFLGPDHRGVPLEVAAIELPDGDLLVIHAMRLRPKYRGNYERVMAWHGRS